MQMQRESAKTAKIPSLFQRGTFMRNVQVNVKVTHIYDLSKFWITPKFKELQLFERFLFKLYHTSAESRRIPFEEIKLNLHCVVHANQSYFRATIVGFVQTHKGDHIVQAFYMDYGVVETVSINNIFYMDKICLQIPRFAVRACLAGICPKSNTDAWDIETAKRFKELTLGKIQMAHIHSVDLKREILYVHLWNLETQQCVHHILKNEGYIKYFQIEENFENSPSTSNNDTKYVYSYLFPSFEALESGRVPSSLSSCKIQKTLISPALMFFAGRYNYKEYRYPEKASVLPPKFHKIN